MSTEWVLRARCPKGFGVASGTAAKLILSKGGDTTLAELRVATAMLSKVSADKLRVRSGFPPKCLLDSPPQVASENTTTVVEAGLCNHDTVLIERQTDAPHPPTENPTTKGKGKGKGKQKQTPPTKQKAASTGIATLKKSATTATTRSKRKWGEGQTLGSNNDNDEDMQPPSSSASSSSSNTRTTDRTASGRTLSATGHTTNTNTNNGTRTRIRTHKLLSFFLEKVSVHQIFQPINRLPLWLVGEGTIMGL
eukprot:m.158422 g.158422  ORF g.158422 m.158422 type:complete len:251 (-) comp31090_c2_seq3:129-881(-)